MKKIERLSGGAYGTVYSAKLLNSEDEKTIYAVKRNYKEEHVTGIYNIRELDILVKLNDHPFIVKIENVLYDDIFPEDPLTPRKEKRESDDSIHFILPLASMDGHDFMSNKQLCNAKNAKLILCQLFIALEYMHSREISHCDIKPQNVLIFNDNNGDLVCKLTDFGMSIPLARDSASTPGITTSWYRAPEVCEGDPHYTDACDIWSMGCLMAEIYGNRALISGATENNVLIKILQRYPKVPSDDYLYRLKRRCPNIFRSSELKCLNKIERKSFVEQMKIDDDMAAELLSYDENYINKIENFMLKLLELDHNKRITATEALDDDFFSEYRKYIQKAREAFPPIPPHFPYITIKKCRERQWVADISRNLYYHYDEIPWYKDRIIFHGIELFDRYLDLTFKKNPAYNRESRDHGFYHSKDDTELYFYSCLYIMHKYFSRLDTLYSWKDFAPSKYVNDACILKFEKFERMLITELNFDIYRISMFEIMEYFVDKITDEYIGLVLTKYTDRELEYTGGSVRALYRKLFNIEKQG
jgi:serine/threonine protein kinase